MIDRDQFKPPDPTLPRDLVADFLPAAFAVPLGRVFLVAEIEGEDLDAEIARQAGPGGLQPEDEVIVLTSPQEFTLPNGEIRRASGDAVEPADTVTT